MIPKTQLAAVLGLSHGVTTIDTPLVERDPPPDVSEFDGQMLQSAPPKPKSGADRIFDMLLGRGDPTGAGTPRAPQPYRPYRVARIRRTATQVDAVLLADAKTIRGEKEFGAAVLRGIAGDIVGLNRRHRVYRMAKALEL